MQKEGKQHQIVQQSRPGKQKKLTVNQSLKDDELHMQNSTYLN